MRNPLIIDIVIIQQGEDDILFKLPLQRLFWEVGKYYISFKRFNNLFIIHKWINYNLDEANMYIKNKETNQYVQILDHLTIDEQDRIIFSEDYLHEWVPLTFLIIQQSQVQINIEQIKLKKDIQVLEREKFQQRDELFKLNKTLELLKQQVAIVEQQSQLIKQASKTSQIIESSIHKSRFNKLDIAILYSNPLLCQNQKPSFLPISYQSEVNTFVQQFKELQVDLNYKIAIATIQNLKEILDMKPKILWIIVHGEYAQKEQKFYLAFEKNGVVDPLYQEDFKHLFPSKSTESTQLIIFSTCHSVEIAQMVQNSCQIPNVIAVSSEYKNEDKESETFYKELFCNLLHSKSIPYSFEQAKKLIKAINGQQCYTCCCAHEHDPECPFEKQRIDLEQGFRIMHFAHISQCNCQFKKEGKHLWGQQKYCKWAYNYIEQLFGPDFTEDLLYDDDALEKIEQKYYIKVCCCEIYSKYVNGIQKEYIHDESIKFKLFSTATEEVIPFKEIEQKLQTEINRLQPQRIENITIMGRAQEMHNIFQFIVKKTNQEKVLYIFGEHGSGRTELVRQALWYSKEREHNLQQMLEDKDDIINIEEVEDMQSLEAVLESELIYEGKVVVKSFNQELNLTNLKKLIRKFHSHRGVLVFDNADLIYQTECKKFQDFLKEFKELCRDLKFIIIIKESTTLFKKLPQVVTPYNSMTIGPLDPDVAAQLLISRLNKRELYPLTQDDMELFNYIDRYPLALIEVAEYQNNNNTSFRTTVQQFNQRRDEKNVKEAQLIQQPGQMNL